MNLCTVRGKNVITQKPKPWPSDRDITRKGMLLTISQKYLEWLTERYLEMFIKNWPDLIKKEHTDIGGVLILDSEGNEEIFINITRLRKEVWQLDYYECENSQRVRKCKMSIIADFSEVPSECEKVFVEKESAGKIAETNEYMLRIVQFMTAIRAYAILSKITDGSMPESAKDTTWRRATIKPSCTNIFGKEVWM